MSRLERSFFIRDVLEVAPDLLGTQIVIAEETRISRYVINEVEAYRGEEDLACHASKGRTARNEIMYREGGHLYVYLIYGMYWMLNIVTAKENIPQAVLIRSVIDCNGPGRLGKKLGIDKSFYGEDLTTSSRIWLEEAPDSVKGQITTGVRINIDYAGPIWKNKPWRYLLS
jgi:DNA-3-methyladenine glycosylase